jgi:sec-independent protein translocase protein TatA
MFLFFAYFVPLFAILTPTTMLLVALVVLLLFGNRLPSVMRSLGRGVTEFKKGIEGIGEDDDVDRAAKKIDATKQGEAVKPNGSSSRVEEQSAKT